jgi:hypothetical protein
MALLAGDATNESRVALTSLFAAKKWRSLSTDASGTAARSMGERQIQIRRIGFRNSSVRNAATDGTRVSYGLPDGVSFDCGTTTLNTKVALYVGFCGPSRVAWKSTLQLSANCQFIHPRWGEIGSGGKCQLYLCNRRCHLALKS